MNKPRWEVGNEFGWGRSHNEGGYRLPKQRKVVCPPVAYEVVIYRQPSIGPLVNYCIIDSMLGGGDWDDVMPISLELIVPTRQLRTKKFNSV